MLRKTNKKKLSLRWIERKLDDIQSIRYSMFKMRDIQILYAKSAAENDKTTPTATVDRSLCRSEQFIDALISTHCNCSI